MNKFSKTQESKAFNIGLIKQGAGFTLIAVRNRKLKVVKDWGINLIKFHWKNKYLLRYKRN